MTLVLGLDVAVARGCDAVVLDDDLAARPVGRVYEAAEFTALLDDLRPEAVAIDAPPHWAPPDQRRDCERDLTARGVRLFTTPNEERGFGHSFYEWMTVGFEMFEAAKPCPALETFPHAVAVAIRGFLPAAGVTRRARTKREWRLDALRMIGVDVAELRSIDEIDAALCAYTAWCWTRGEAVEVGDERDGKITLPVTTLLDRYVR